MLDQLAARGVERVAVTLHVGYGTFQPIRVDTVEAHEMEAEHYEASVQMGELALLPAVAVNCRRTGASRGLSSRG